MYRILIVILFLIFSCDEVSNVVTDITSTPSDVEKPLIEAELSSNRLWMTITDNVDIDYVLISGYNVSSGSYSEISNNKILFIDPQPDYNSQYQSGAYYTKSISNIFPYDNSINEIEIQTKDSAGNSDKLVVIKTETPPDTELPVIDAIYYDYSDKINLTITDNIGLSNVIITTIISEDGNTNVIFIDPNPESSWGYIYEYHQTLEDVTSGLEIYSLVIEAWDLEANHSTFTIIFDEIEPPVPDTDSPVISAEYNETFDKLEIDITDNIGLSYIVVTAHTFEDGYSLILLIDPNPENNYSENFYDIIPHEINVNTVEIEAWDFVGNYSTVSVVINEGGDEIAPIIYAEYKEYMDGIDLSITDEIGLSFVIVTGYTTDDGNSFVLFIDPQPDYSMHSDGAHYSNDLRDIIPDGIGINTIEIEAWDLAGNYSTVSLIINEYIGDSYGTEFNIYVCSSTSKEDYYGSLDGYADINIHIKIENNVNITFVQISLIDDFPYFIFSQPLTEDDILSPYHSQFNNEGASKQFYHEVTLPSAYEYIYSKIQIEAWDESGNSRYNYLYFDVNPDKDEDCRIVDNCSQYGLSQDCSGNCIGSYQNYSDEYCNNVMSPYNFQCEEFNFEEGACIDNTSDCESQGLLKDCNGICFKESHYLDWQTDGECDCGQFGYNFNCAEWNYDNGDCSFNTTCSDSQSLDCDGKCVSNSTLDLWLGDGICDQNNYYEYYSNNCLNLNCEVWNYDNGDCE